MAEESMARSIFNSMYSLARSILKPLLGDSTLDKAESLVDQAVDQSLSILSFLDEQLYRLGELVETSFKSALDAVSAPVSTVRSQGLIGSSSDCQEPVWRSTVVHLVNLLVYIVSYVFEVASAWLVQHHRQIGQLQFVDDEHDEDDSYVPSKLPAENHNEPPHESVKEKVVDDLRGQDLVKEKISDDNVHVNNHDFVKEKISDDDADLKNQDFVKDGGVDDGHRNGHQHDESDELTKLFDATWSLGTL